MNGIAANSYIVYIVIGEWCALKVTQKSDMR